MWDTLVSEPAGKAPEPAGRKPEPARGQYGKRKKNNGAFLVDVGTIALCI